MFTKRILASLLVLLFATGLSGDSHTENLDDLRCDLQMSGGDYLSTALWSHFHFLLLSSKDGLQVFTDSNMWGYFARSFTLEAEGKTYEVTRRNQDWDKNYPEPITINRGRVLVTDIHLCDGSWQVSPKLPRKTQYFRIVGRYTLHPENDPKERRLMSPINNLWHGAIKSDDPLELALSKGCVLRLNSNKRK